MTWTVANMSQARVGVAATSVADMAVFAGGFLIYGGLESALVDTIGACPLRYQLNTTSGICSPPALPAPPCPSPPNWLRNGACLPCPSGAVCPGTHLFAHRFMSVVGCRWKPCVAASRVLVAKRSHPAIGPTECPFADACPGGVNTSSCAPDYTSFVCSVCAQCASAFASRLVVLIRACVQITTTIRLPYTAPTAEQRVPIAQSLRRWSLPSAWSWCSCLLLSLCWTTTPWALP